MKLNFYLIKINNNLFIKYIKYILNQFYSNNILRYPAKIPPIIGAIIYSQRYFIGSVFPIIAIITAGAIDLAGFNDPPETWDPVIPRKYKLIPTINPVRFPKLFSLIVEAKITKTKPKVKIISIKKQLK